MSIHPIPAVVGVNGAVGVDGKLLNMGWRLEGFKVPGEPNCMPHEGEGDFALFSCSCLSEKARTSLTEFDIEARRIETPSGESGGESQGGESGGDNRVEVGDIEKEDFGRVWRKGEPS